MTVEPTCDKAEVCHIQHDGSLDLQPRSQKYGKLQRGQLLTVPAYLVKRRKQHFHHLEQYDADLILGCNGFVWVGEHAVVDEETNSNEDQHKLSMEVEAFTPLETRRHICRLANAVRVLSALGFTLTVELIIQTAEAGLSSDVEINNMLGAEFYVQTAEREAKRRADLSRRMNGPRLAVFSKKTVYERKDAFNKEKVVVKLPRASAEGDEGGETSLPREWMVDGERSEPMPITSKNGGPRALYGVRSINYGDSASAILAVIMAIELIWRHF
uniref:K Homology domain-containing protein n=1 Tax=Aegilops tauschii TaxID=37682 RepID=M8BUN4_AEGTA